MDLRANRKTAGLAAHQEARAAVAQEPVAAALARGAEGDAAELLRDEAQDAVLPDDHARQAGLGGKISPDRDHILLGEGTEAGERLALGIDEDQGEAILAAALGGLVGEGERDAGRPGA